jgi:hypothetical protein
MTAGGASAAAAAGGTAVIAADEVPSSALPKDAGGRTRRRRGADASTGREALPLWLRITVWVIALPLGLLVVGLPARQLGYLTSQKLLDVIVKRDLGRFVPIIVVVALWALVTAVLVTILIEGGRRWMVHRRERARRSGHSS